MFSLWLAFSRPQLCSLLHPSKITAVFLLPYSVFFYLSTEQLLSIFPPSIFLTGLSHENNISLKWFLTPYILIISSLIAIHSIEITAIISAYFWFKPPWLKHLNIQDSAIQKYHFRNRSLKNIPVANYSENWGGNVPCSVYVGYSLGTHTSMHIHLVNDRWQSLYGQWKQSTSLFDWKPKLKTA